MHYIWWNFNEGNFKELNIQFTIYNEPSTNDGLYLQMYNGEINGTSFYFGLQTRVSKPGYGLTGKGFIFSRWGTNDLSNAKTANSGWTASGNEGGLFIGVRKSYNWTNHKYTIQIKYEDSDNIGDWYGIYIQDQNANTNVYLGSLRFPFSMQAKKGISNGGGTWTEIYYKEVANSPLPDWHISIDKTYGIDFSGTNFNPVSADLSCSQNFQNINIEFHDNDQSIHFLMGSGITKQFTNKKINFNQETLPPSAPLNLKTSVSNYQVILTWEPSSKGTYPIEGYAIYRGTTPGNESSTPITTVGLTTTYTDINIIFGNSYYYYLKAFDTQGNYSEPSNEVSVTVHDTIPPTINVSYPEDGTITDHSSINIIGTVSDKESGINKLTINGSDVTLNTSGSFDFTINLNKGDNIINLVATDKAGNRFYKIITIKLAEPNIKRTVLTLQIDNKLMLVNKQEVIMDVAPIIIEGRTLLPIRWIAEPLGASVNWDAAEKKVTVSFGNEFIELWIGKNTALVNGTSTLIDPSNPKVVPVIINLIDYLLIY